MSPVSSSIYRKDLLRPRSKGDSVLFYPDPGGLPPPIVPLGTYHTRKNGENGEKRRVLGQSPLLVSNN